MIFLELQTDLSSTESFDDRSPIRLMVEPIAPVKAEEMQALNEVKKDIFSNENTLVSTSSSSSNEGLTLTLTTNSPTSETSPKIRKTSWIKSENYPHTLSSLLNLFHNPASIFTKTSPESTLSSTKATMSKDDKPIQKENSFSGFFNSLVSLTHKKDDKTVPNESFSILQNISPENTVVKNSFSSGSQMVLDALSKNVKHELKENISPENTISSDNLASFTKVRFLVGDEDSTDVSLDPQEDAAAMDEGAVSEDVSKSNHLSLGEITRDSMSILKAKEEQ